MPDKFGSKTLDDVLHDEPRDEHQNHQCELVRRREMAKVMERSKNPKYICMICGRVANNAKDLCLPVELK